MIKHSIWLAALWLFSTVDLPAQTLDDYVREGLSNNLGLKQQHLLLEKSEQSLRQAQGLFLPSITLNARYSATYGNVVNLGSLINPAFGALNQLTNSSQFPTTLDIQLPFRQETKVSVAQSILQPAVLFNYQIYSSLREADAAGLNAAERQFVADLKTAYFNVAKTQQVVSLYEKTLPLLEENVRVNERLAANGKATSDKIYRVRAELSDVLQKQADALQQADAAAQYFNFLLNRAPDAPVRLVSDSLFTVENQLTAPRRNRNDEPPGKDTGLPRAQQLAQQNREEFRQLKSGIAASDANVRINTATFFPTLSLGIDYGFQGMNYDFRRGQDYGIVSLVAQWNIFNGFQDDAKRQQAVLESDRLKVQLSETERQIALQVRLAHNEMNVAQAAISTASDRLLSAQKSFEIVQKRYDQGAAAQVEFLDARTAFTNAGINEILTRYDYFIKQARFERAAGLFTLTSQR